MSEKNEQVLDVRATLRDFVSAQEPGAMLDYLAVETATGIKMDPYGRAELKRACRAARTGYQTRYGRGIVLTSARNALEHQQERIAGIGRHVDRVAKASARDLDRLGSEMSSSDAQKMIANNAFLATVSQSQRLSVPLQKTLPVFVKPPKSES